MSRSTYALRKLQGLCVECGKEKVEESVRCEKCNEKRKESYRRCREYRLSIGICPYCKTNQIMGDEKICPECSFAEHTKYLKKDKEVLRERSKKQRVRIKAVCQDNKNICHKCLKPKADDGYNTCPKCRLYMVKYNEQKRVKRAEKFSIKQYREEHGLCRYCNEPRYLEQKLCKKHYDEICERNKKLDRSYFRQQNRLLFAK